MFRIPILLLLSSLAFARVTPLEEFQKPHSVWQHVPLEYRAFTPRFDEYLNQRLNSDHSGEIQNEEQVLINPTDPDNMVAVWRDFREGYRRCGVGYTLDGGTTWHDTLFPQMYYAWQSDPTLAVDHNGVFTANVISFEEGGNTDNGLLSVSSYDGGVTWQDSVWGMLTTDESSFEDKQMFAIDNSPDSPYQGTHYLAWARFYRNPDTGNYDSTHINLVYKRPGEAYAPPQIISDTRSVQWANVATGPNGEVYLTWGSYSNDAIMFSRSLDGGTTWTAEDDLFPTSFTSANIEPALLVFSYMVMAVDNTTGPNRGRIYALYTNDNATHDHTEVFFTRSDNHGDTWTTPVLIDDENRAYPVDQFHPWISVDEAGRVWCAWYDRRNDPNNLLMDVYFTVSEDGGQTWRANERITEVSCNPGAGTLDAGLIGEYIGWHASADKAVCVWTDTRLGDQDAFVAIIDSVFEPNAAADPFNIHPSSFILSAAFPNPFNGSTTLSYSLTSPADVSLTVYNTLGQQVLRSNLGYRASGTHTHALELSEPSGVYFAKLSAGSEQAMAKLLLMR